MDIIPGQDRNRLHRSQKNALKGPLIHLDLHHPPCSSFNANRAFYCAGQIARNLLVAMQMNLLPKEVSMGSEHYPRFG